MEDMLQRSMLRSAITAKARSRKSEMNYHYKIILYKINGVGSSYMVQRR